MTAARHQRPGLERGLAGAASIWRAPVDNGSRMIIVSPPPGVASAVRLPPMASVNPFATAKPEPDPGGLRGVVEPLERPEHFHDTLRRDSPAVIDDPQLARRAPFERRRASPPAAPTRTMSESGAYFTAFSTMFAITRSSMPGSASTSGMFGGRSTRTRPAGTALREPGMTSYQRTGLSRGLTASDGDPGHVQQIAHQRVQPVRTLLYRCQQLLLLFLGVMDVVVAQPADGKLDPGQGGAQVVRDCAEDGGPHRVAFGQAQHLPPAGHQLLAFQLGRQMNTERRRGDAGRWPAESVRTAPGGGGVDFFDVVRAASSSGSPAGTGRNFSGGGLKLPRRSGPAPPSPSAKP